jgi:hypothetical protein
MILESDFSGSLLISVFGKDIAVLKGATGPLYLLIGAGPTSLLVLLQLAVRINTK